MRLGIGLVRFSSNTLKRDVARGLKNSRITLQSIQPVGTDKTIRCWHEWGERKVICLQPEEEEDEETDIKETELSTRN